ncbi:MAG: dihydropteroate synthase [Schumannella sp.]
MRGRLPRCRRRRARRGLGKAWRSLQRPAQPPGAGHPGIPASGSRRTPSTTGNRARRRRASASLGHGILIGASRKRFVGALLPEDAPMTDRDAPTAVISALAARSGAWAVRVHDVPSTRLALDVWERWEAGAAIPVAGA